MTDKESMIRDIVTALAISRGYAGPPPAADSALQELGFDSLLTIELIARVESLFEIEILDDDLTARSFADVRSIVEVIARASR